MSNLTHLTQDNERSLCDREINLLGGQLTSQYGTHDRNCPKCRQHVLDGTGKRARWWSLHMQRRRRMQKNWPGQTDIYDPAA